MPARHARLPLLGLLLVLACPARAETPDLWFSAGGRIEVQGTPVDVQAITRFDDGFDFQRERYVEITPSRKLNDTWTLGVLLRAGEARSTPTSAWRNEYRISPTLSGTVKASGWDFQSRLRIERRFREAASDTWRGRIRLLARAPWKGPLEARPYASIEWFHDFAADRLDQRRILGGIALAPAKGWSTDLYAGWRTVRSTNGWKDRPTLGLTVSRRF